MKEERILRWGLVERIEHHIVMIVVPIFILTGVVLFVPEWFSWMLPEWFSRMLPFASPNIFRIVHRVLAVTYAGTGIFHLLYHIIARRGRSKIWPTKKDWSDAVTVLEYYFGRAKEPPKLGFHNPLEKILVYWFMAVVAMIIMGITGLILMFPGTFPRWIHIYALILHDIFFILITAVLILHFYMTVLYPGYRPLLDGMFTDGTVPADYVKKEMPIWYEEVVGEE